MLLQEGQIQRSIAETSSLSFVEFEGMVALLHYDVRELDRNTLSGTATRISTLIWEHERSPVRCRIFR